MDEHDHKNELVPGFDRDRFEAILKTAEPPGIRSARESAYEQYVQQPMPTVKMEEWRRTDPGLFPFQATCQGPGLELSAERVGAGDWDASFDVVVDVEDRRYSVTDVSGAVATHRIHVLSLQEASRAFPEMTAECLNGRVKKTRGKLEYMTEAFWNLGLLIHVPRDVVLEKGVLIRYACKESGSIVVPRIVMTVGSGSRAVLMESLTSPDEAALMALMGKDLVVGDNAQLKVVSLQEWGAGTAHLSSDWAVVGRDSKIEWMTLNLGGRLSKTKFGCDVAGQGANAEMNGLYFASGEQHFDQKTLQVHSAPNTFSNLLYKGAVKDKSYSVYQGLIIARPGAVKVDAYQKNNNLVLNDGARADSLPGLEIDTDDLKCSHGSTIGNLDDEQIFYLRSRGLDEAAARRILMRAFFEEIVGRLPYDFLKNHVREAVERKYA